MATYNITYVCGHEGSVRLTGPKRTREWIVSNKEKELCPECYKKHLEEERAAEREAAQVAAKEQELPDLIGTEKQVNWALTIRAKFLDLLDKMLQSNYLDEDEEAEIVRSIVSIQNETAAAWWIDNCRNATDYVYVHHVLLKRLKDLPEEPSVIEAEIIPIIRPENPVSELIAIIEITDDTISIQYPEINDDFKEIVKSHGFRWSGGYWKRALNDFNGSVDDRAGEIGNLLLKAGIVVQVNHVSAREKAISGTYEPEQKRWIKRLTDGKYKDYFSLTWEYGNQTIYEATRSIAGSRWNKPAVVIPAAQYEAVLDLVDEYGFKLSTGAERLVQETKRLKESALVVTPGDAPEPINEVKRSTPGEIDDELRDDN